MRKPRPFKCCGTIPVADCKAVDIGGVETRHVSFTGEVCSEGAERLAAWLLKAAEWIREKETER